MNWCRALAVLLWLFLPARPDLLAAEPASVTDTAPPAPPPAPPPAGPPAVRPQPPAPAERFTPSEKIGADSAVSFPVDI